MFRPTVLSPVVRVCRFHCGLDFYPAISTFSKALDNPSFLLTSHSVSKTVQICRQRLTLSCSTHLRQASLILQRLTMTTPNADLVPRDNSGRKFGIHIQDGVLSKGATHDARCWIIGDCTCPEPPTTLLESLTSASASSRDKALEMMLSQNEIELYGSPTKSLAWLKQLGPHVRQIRELCLSLDHTQVLLYDGNQDTFPQEWSALVSFIREELDLPQLTLVVSDALSFQSYQETQTDEASILVNAYRKSIEPLKGMGKSGLKAFYFYAATFHEEEAGFEREVMGNGYVAKDKKPAPEG